jgi:hypothetical protein
MMVRVADEQRHLAQADCHIAEAEDRIARQEQLIGRLAAAGLDTSEAENLLEMLHQSLALVHAHRQMILRAFGK